MRYTASNDPALMALVRAIVAGDTAQCSRLVAASPDLARQGAVVGASRQAAPEYFFEEIGHYLYAGDTPLHMAAAGYRAEIAQLLVGRGADCSARNRRGATPLHYAADTNVWNPVKQIATIECLLRAGADPNVVNKNGVTPLHRAVRTRSAPAVEALLAGGADPRRKNGSGSTALDLARINSGRGGTGTPHAIEQQRQIILLLTDVQRS